MKRRLFALAIGAPALLPLGLPQPASAYDYYDGYGRNGRLERDIDHDRAKLDRDYAEHRYYSERTGFLYAPCGRRRSNPGSACA